MSTLKGYVTNTLSNSTLFSPRSINFLLVFVLSLAAVKANWNIDRLVDINGWDETEYLTIGVEMPRAGLPRAASETFFAPFYSLWYLALAQVEPVPSRLIYLNYKIMAIILPCSLYCILRRAGCRLLPATMAAFYLIVNDLSLNPDTRSIHFAMLFLALGIWGSLCTQGFLKQACVLGLSAVGASYVRPEYSLLVVTFGAVVISNCAVRRLLLTRDEWRTVICSGLAVVGCVAVLGSPIFSGNNRSFGALCQGFSSNYHGVHPSGLNPWKDYSTIASGVFGPCESVSQALFNNPSMFLWHVSYNLAGFFKGLVPAIVHHRNFLLPAGHRMEILENAILVFTGAVFLAVNRKAVISRSMYVAKRYPLILLFVIGASAVSVLGVLLTLVQARYFFPIVFLGLFAAFLCIGCNEDDFPGTKSGLAPAHVLVGCFLVLGATPASSFYEKRNTPLRSALAEIARFKFKDPTGYLEGLGDKRMRVYLDNSIQYINFNYRSKSENETFGDFLRLHNVGIVHVTSLLKHDRLFLDDPEWNEFVSDPEAFGFEIIPLPWNEALYVKKSALAL